MLSLVWFKRDLRVIDHSALALAAEQGAVLPVYIVEPDLWAQPDASTRHWQFVCECIQDLRRDLAELGQPLILREGDAVEVLARLRAKHKFTQILSHLETGNTWSQQRDQRVAAWARDKGLPWVQLPQSAVTQDGGNGRAFMAQPLAQVTALPPVAEGTGALPSMRSLKLAEDRCPSRQTGGRAAGLLALEGFLTARGKTYRTAKSSPLTAERVCSRLSPYLTYGAISAREVAQQTMAAKTERRGQGAWPASLRNFEQNLGLRDQFVQAFNDHPALDLSAQQSALSGLAPPIPDAARLSAWQNGETGLPFVDACMRYLRATGWLSTQMRALLQSVASYHLWLDWRASGLHLARMFTDYEPGIHWAHVHAHAGIGGARARIYDSVKLGRAQDPKGVFIRRWLPELAPIPDVFVHEPWKYPQARAALAARYPEPIVDPASAMRAARAAIAARRQSPAFQAAAAKLMADKPRRKPMPAPGPRGLNGAQLWLDL